MLRSCYQTLMRFPSGQGFIEIPVRWFFADKLPWLKGKTPYASINYRGEDEKPPAGVGEVVGAARTWVNGANPNPNCCKPVSQYGGARAGGEALYWLDYRQTGDGGILLDGAGRFGSGWESTGGLSFDGAGRFGSGWRSTGGLSFDGAGSFGSGFKNLQGGEEFDGAGSFGSGSEALQGGEEFDGAGSFGSGSAATGGEKFDGAGSFGSGFQNLQGGLLFDGLSVFGGGFGALGGMLWDGAGEFLFGEECVCPPGIIVHYGGGEAPDGWLTCNGQAVSRTTYAALFGVIGTTFGTGDGSTTFNLPDVRSRMILGTGTGSGLTGRSLNDTGGSESHQIASADLPTHTHTITQIGIGGFAGATTVDAGSPTSGATWSGTGTALAWMNPFIALGCIIKT